MTGSKPNRWWPVPGIVMFVIGIMWFAIPAQSSGGWNLILGSIWVVGGIVVGYILATSEERKVQLNRLEEQNQELLEIVSGLKDADQAILESLTYRRPGHP